MSLWNGNRAALSLTFDDALACQLKYAVPAMDANDVRGTFFAIGDCSEYPLDVVGWRPAFKRGHEVGSHSVKHLKAASLNEKTAAFETKESKRILENHFGVPVTSYCYPYTDAPTLLQDAVRKAGYTQARGGRVARADKYVKPTDGVNMLNIPCFHVNGACFSHGETNAWVDAALERNAWLTLMFHGVGPDDNVWDNVHEDTFSNFMRFLKAATARGLWVAPFGEVAQNLRENSCTTS